MSTAGEDLRLGRRRKGEEEGASESGKADRPPHRKLKPGPGLPPEVVFADQRRRLLDAVIECTADRGFRRVTVRALSQQAGVSTRTFYRHFSSVADCLGSACESVMQCALLRMEEAGSTDADPAEKSLRLSISSLMTEIAAKPDAASVALVDAFDGGPVVLGQLRPPTLRLEQLIANRLKTLPGQGDISRRLLGGMVAGVLRIVRTTTSIGRADELPRMASAICDWMLAVATAATPTGGVPGRAGVGPRPRREPHPYSSRPAADPPRGATNERDRIFRATVKLAAAGGLGTLTITKIRQSAGVSRRSFNAQFGSLSDCFLDSVEWLAGVASARGLTWAAGAANKDQHLSRLLIALSAQAARNPTLAGLVLDGMLDAGRDGLLRREHLITIGSISIRADLADPMPAWSVDASLAAAWHIAATETAEGRAKDLPRLSPLLSRLILTTLHQTAHGG